MPHVRHNANPARRSKYQSSSTPVTSGSTANRTDDIPETELDGFGHPRIPFRGYYEKEKNDLRRRWAEKFAGGKSLEFVSDWWSVDGRESLLVSRSMTQLRGNLENPIGLAKVPIGLVGPVLMQGKHVDG